VPHEAIYVHSLLHSPWCFTRTLGRSVFGSLSTFSIAVRVSKPPTTLKDKEYNFQLSQHAQNIPALLDLLYLIYVHYSSRFLNHHVWGKGHQQLCLEDLRYYHSVRKVRIFSQVWDLNLKLNRTWKRLTLRGKAKPFVQKLGSHTNQQDGERMAVDSHLCKKTQTHFNMGSLANVTSINLDLICYSHRL